MITKDLINTGYSGYGYYNCALPPVNTYNGTNAYSVIADNGALDIGANNIFVLCGWIKGQDTTPGTFAYAFGKNTYGGVYGRYGFGTGATQNVTFYFETTGGQAGIDTGVDLTADSTAHHYLALINQTTSKIHIYLDGVEVGTGTSFTGTWPAMANEYEFYIGAGNAGNGSTPLRYLQCNVADVRIYHTDVTGDLIEIIDGDILGSEVLHVPNNTIDYSYDITSNARHLTGSNVTISYGSEGSKLPASNGYSLWQKGGSPDIQVPYDATGSAISLTPGTNIPSGYTKTRDVAGSSSYWNMADALFDFDPKGTTASELDMFDRSNATIHNATSRAAGYYYASNPYRWHISEITDPTIYDTYFEAAYKDRIFAKLELTGADITRYEEQLNYATQKVGADLNKVLSYCGITNIYP